MLRPEVGLIRWLLRPGREEIGVLEERVEAAQPETKKNAAGERAAFFAGDENVGAGRAFGIGQGRVLLHNELPAQRNHEQHANPAADESKHKDAGVFEIETEEDQRRQRENDSGSDGLAGVARGLNDVVFKNGGAAKGAQNADGKHRNGYGCRDSEPGAQTDIDRDGAENQPEK